MAQGLDTAIAALFIMMIPLLIGGIPVLIGWDRIRSQWSSTGRRTPPKALWALTVSICIGPIGTLLFRIVGDLLAKPLGLVDILPLQLWVAFLGVGFILNLAGLATAVYERNSARVAVLAGSIAVAVVFAVGFAWLFSTSRGASMWSN